jgi:hypothetical protein
VSERLPELMDNKRIRDEMGVTRHAADKIMQQVRTVRIPGLDRNYAYRDEVFALVRSATFSKDEVQP